MRFIWIFVILSAFNAAASALTCYDCNSLTDPRCNQYFYPEGVKQIDCDEAEMPEYLHKFERRFQPTGCITKIHNGVAGNRFFIRRGCYYGFVDNTDEACIEPDPYVPWAELLDCHVCTTDLCNTNSGEKLKLGKMILSIGVLLSLMAFKFI